MKKRLLCMLLAALLLVGLMPAAFAEGNIITYTVKSGDMIETICESVGIDYYKCRSCIMKLNDFRSYDRLEILYVGQTIKLPASVEVSAKIMSGELNLDGTVPEKKPAETPAAGSGNSDYKTISHTVGEWDTLISVCGGYGMNYYNVKAAIMKLNGFTTDAQLDRLSNGQIVKLPASEDDAKKIVASGTAGSSGSSGSTGSSGAASGSTTSYVVKAGDTFISICADHGLNFYAIRNQLIKLNGFKNASQLDSLRVGQTVKLPGGSGSSKPEAPSTPSTPSTPSAGGSKPAESEKPAEYKTISHTVGEWDTLIGICGKYGMNFYNVKYAIMKLNGFTSERQLDILRNGQVIKLPAGENDAKLIMSSGKSTAASGGSTSTGSSETGDRVAYYIVPYTFQSGDTVYNVCRSMGIDFDKNSDLIKKLNSISDYRAIADGKVLLLPSSSAPSSGTYYKIVAHKILSGETTESIAAGLGQDHSKILGMMKTVNGRDNLEMIYAGATLYVPVSCKA